MLFSFSISLSFYQHLHVLLATRSDLVQIGIRSHKPHGEVAWLTRVMDLREVRTASGHKLDNSLNKSDA